MRACRACDCFAYGSACDSAKWRPDQIGKVWSRNRLAKAKNGKVCEPFALANSGNTTRVGIKSHPRVAVPKSAQISPQFAPRKTPAAHYADFCQFTCHHMTRPRHPPSHFFTRAPQKFFQATKIMPIFDCIFSPRVELIY